MPPDEPPYGHDAGSMDSSSESSIRELRPNDPETQGRGLGRALLELGLARADRSRHPVYLETFREGTARMYARFGFEPVGRARVGRTGPHFTAMLRPGP